MIDPKYLFSSITLFHYIKLRYVFLKREQTQHDRKQANFYYDQSRQMFINKTAHFI